VDEKAMKTETLAIIGAGAVAMWWLSSKTDKLLNLPTELLAKYDVGSGNAGEMATTIEQGRTLKERYAGLMWTPPSDAPYWYDQLHNKRDLPMGIMGTVYNRGGEPFAIVDAVSQWAVKHADLNKRV
jgi:hypothetical protein